jgi:hypothetical protein
MRRIGLIRIYGLCLCWLLTAAGPALAQGLKPGENPYTLPPGSMPSWTVPVLRLVSATHVEPTTGVVISDTGLVLVPEDFAGMGDEIIVLDGGTDIIRNGRPARIEQKFAFEGLQVLAVDGLSRQGVTLAATAVQQGDEALLVAFPPAEQIAEGKPPLSISAAFDVFSENDRPSLSAESELPNVTGALVDSCGNLVGVSLADDVQSMESSPATRYLWREALLKVFAQMGIPLREYDCSATEVVEPEPLVEEPEAEPPPEPVVDEPPAAEPEAEPADTLIDEELPEPEAEQELPVEEPVVEEPIPDTLPPIKDKGSGLGVWLWLLAAVMLAGLGFVIHHIRKKAQDNPPDAENPVAESEAPPVVEGDDEPEELPAQLDSELKITGTLGDGTAFEDSCAVGESAINVIIGRGDTDLVIDSPAVSRRHVSLNGTFGNLTVSDLGSSNGTSINGVPCLEGEIMFMEHGDTLILGDARCSLEIRPRGLDGGEKD